MFSTISQRWRYALAIAALAAVAIWAFWPSGDGFENQSPKDDRVTVATAVPKSSPRSSPRSSPFLSSHESTPSDAPTGQNVDRRFHAEMEQLRKSVQADSNSVADMLKLARMSQDAHQLDEAITLYQRIVEIEPENRDAWLDLSRCYGLQKDWAGALRAVDKMLVQFDDDLGALYNRGAILANMGNEAEARQVWMKVAQQDEDERLKFMAVSAIDQLDGQ